MVEKLTKDTFDAAIRESDVPVLVDCFATWCGPCKMMAPIVDDIAEDYEGKLRVYKVDVDEAPEIAMNYGIMSIPCLILFDHGNEINRHVGFAPKSLLESMVNDN